MWRNCIWLTGMFVVVVCIFASFGYVWLSNYHECRAHGFSVLYCATP